VKVDLTGKVAVVTGGGGVLCSAFAMELAKSGAKVAVLDLRQDAAETVAQKINDNGDIAIGIACDVLHTGSVKAAAQMVTTHLGPCSILVNGAGGNHPLGTTSKETLEWADLDAKEPDVITFFDLDPQGFASVLNLNFMGTLIPTQVFAKEMACQPGASVINISSMSAFCPMTKVPAYSGAKAAVSNFTQWLAVHLAKVGIRVNAIAPGFFLTEQNRRLLINDDGTLTERSHKIITHTPLGRFGDPKDLLGTLLWLSDPEASGFITGTVIPVDGGFMAYSGV
jgi:NAD(P)-dependent dehydrogenase (short-subunit alcohol dehydrogenase family)